MATTKGPKAISEEELMSATLDSLRNEFAKTVEKQADSALKIKEPTPADFIEPAEDEEDLSMYPRYSELFAEYGAKTYLKAKKLKDFRVSHYFNVSDWDEDVQNDIPDEGDYKGKFVADHSVIYPTLRAMCRNLKVMVYGPTGSGKTETQRFICALTHQPYLRINGRQDMETDAILGKPWVSEGTMHFDLGALPSAIKKGYMVAFDEPWKTPSGIQMALQRYYERNGVLFLDDMPGTMEEKTITPDPRSRLVLCDNVVGTGDNLDQYGATMVQDNSTLNRLDVIILQDYLNPANEVKLITSRYPSIPQHKAKLMVQLAGKIRQGLANSELSTGFSPRNYMAWAEMAYDYRSYEEGFRQTMLHRFNRDDTEKQAVVGMYRTVFGEKL